MLGEDGGGLGRSEAESLLELYDDHTRMDRESNNVDGTADERMRLLRESDRIALALGARYASGLGGEILNKVRARQDKIWRRIREIEESTMPAGVSRPSTSLIDAAIATWNRLIEQRWRDLSDGERIRLMKMSCAICGSCEPCDHGRR